MDATTDDERQKKGEAEAENKVLNMVYNALFSSIKDLRSLQMSPVPEGRMQTSTFDFFH